MGSRSSLVSQATTRASDTLPDSSRTTIMCCKNRSRLQEDRTLAVAERHLVEADNMSLISQATAPSQPPSYKAVMRADQAAAQGSPAPGLPLTSSGTQLAPTALSEAEKTCLALGGHDEKRKYGAVGIIAGVVFFPWGLFWTRCDSSVVCKRCHTTLKANDCRRDGAQYPNTAYAGEGKDNYPYSGIASQDSCRGCQRARRHHRRHCGRHYQAF